MSVDSFLAPPPSVERERVTPVMPIDWTCSFREVAQSAATAGYECYFLYYVLVYLCLFPSIPFYLFFFNLIMCLANVLQYEYKNEQYLLNSRILSFDFRCSFLEALPSLYDCYSAAAVANATSNHDSSLKVQRIYVQYICDNML